MRINFVISLLMLLGITMALGKQGANDKENTKQTPTSVWVTATTNGKLTTMQTVYHQSFMKTYKSAQNSDVKSGDVGMGTIKGSVGGVHSYQHVTISSSAEAGGRQNNNHVYAGILGGLLLLFGAFV